MTSSDSWVPKQLNPMIMLPIGRSATELTAWKAVSGARQIEELLL
jgi:hypothetical protein